MPLDTAAYHANAKECEERAQQMPPELRRDLLTAARQWRKLAALADKRENDLAYKTPLGRKQA